MQIVLFVHGRFIGSKSMPKFANMIATWLEQNGHTVEVWEPKPFFFNISSVVSLKKYLGYIDEFIIFPVIVKRRLHKCSPETLFVFTDNALGPWVPLVKNRKHVVHCHDFLAQQVSLGMIENQKLSWSGRIYQAYIRSGYRSGKNFISVSDKTRKDLHNLLGFTPSFSKVVLNGLNNDFASPVKLPGDSKPSFFSKQGQHGFILHVGGNQWYKNRVGVVLIYNAWRTLSNRKLPLLLIGPPASGQLVTAKCKSTFEQDIHFINDASDEVVKFAYQHASVFLFPSIAEGFGWPVAEAMSAGCPVITTNEEPMSEVGSDAAFYIPKMPSRVAEVDEWQSSCAEVLETVTSLEQDERDAVKKAGKLNALRFDTSTSMKQIEKYYFELVEPGKLVTEDRQSVQNHVAET